MIILLIAACLGLLVGGCGKHPQSILDAASPEAREIANLWWVMFAVCSVVFAAVMVFLYKAVFSRGGSLPPGGQIRFVVGGGIILPAVVLVGFLIYSLRVSILIAPPANAMTIEVTGHQWWWEVRYPEEKITTANEIHIPAGVRVRIRLRSHDVIHSFWVPNLHGKIDMFPETPTQIWIQADEPGIWSGQCAEFCGTQHALMRFEVIAHEEAEFAEWVAARQQAAATVRDSHSGTLGSGGQLFLRHGCNSCHDVAGMPAASGIGPDLTHLGNRRKLAAAVIPNDREHLAEWILNPQEVKPGNRMPATRIEAEELQTLVDYLLNLDGDDQ